jgi:PhnB protein
MAIQAYINFAGNCREAVNYYADVFGSAEPRFMTFSEMPSDPSFPLPEGAKSLIMHAELEITGSIVMFSDVFPGMELVVGNNVSLTVVTADKNFIISAFSRLREGGEVHMDLQETFWSKLYGNLRDKYGVEWQFSLDSGEARW